MLQFVKGQSKNIIVTVSDLTTLANTYYLFVFIHETTKEVINVIKPASADLSSFKYRFNKFLFDSSIFANSSIGKYTYTIYEQLSSTNTNVTGLNAVEFGKMDLNIASTPVNVFDEYSSPTTFSTYAG